MSILLIGLVVSSCEVRINEADKYLGLTPPKNIPELFAPEIVSTKDHSEYGVAITEQGDEIFFSRGFDRSSKIMHTQLTPDGWTEPKVFIDKYQFSGDPFLHGKDRLYFISTVVDSITKRASNYEIYYIQKKGKIWEKELIKPEKINSDEHEFFVSLDKNGNLYYASNKKDTSNNFELFYYDVLTGTDNYIEELGSPAYDADPFIAPDGSFLLFASSREGGKGSNDIYLSIKNDTLWSDPISIGGIVNTEKSEFCPYITPDGKYFFFYRDGDIYWVSADIIYNLVKSQKTMLKDN